MTKLIVGECEGEMYFATLGDKKDGHLYGKTQRLRNAFWVPLDSKKQCHEVYTQQVIESNIMENVLLEDFSDYEYLLDEQMKDVAIPIEKKFLKFTNFIKLLTQYFKS